MFIPAFVELKHSLIHLNMGRLLEEFGSVHLCSRGAESQKPTNYCFCSTHPTVKF